MQVDYSNLNFKDAMVATGSYPGLQFPMVGGIDLVGRVLSTTNPHLKKGDEVLINGFGMGTDHWGGFAEKASVPGHWCVVSVGHPFQPLLCNRLLQPHEFRKLLLLMRSEDSQRS